MQLFFNCRILICKLIFFVSYLFLFLPHLCLTQFLLYIILSSLWLWNILLLLLISIYPVIHLLKCIHLLHRRYYYIQLCSLVHVYIRQCRFAFKYKIRLIHIFFTVKYWRQYRCEVRHLTFLLFVLGLFCLAVAKASQQDNFVHTLQEPFLLWHLAWNIVQLFFRVHQILLWKVYVIFENLLKGKLLNKDHQ